MRLGLALTLILILALTLTVAQTLTLTLTVTLTRCAYLERARGWALRLGPSSANPTALALTLA